MGASSPVEVVDDASEVGDAIRAVVDADSGPDGRPRHAPLADTEWEPLEALLTPAASVSDVVSG